MAIAKSSRQKGSELERKFAAFMKKEMGYSDCFLNRKVKGKLRSNEIEVDIVGKKLSEKAKNDKKNGNILIALGLLIAALFFFDFIPGGMELFLIIGTLIIGGGLYLQYAKEKEYEYTWVECKNWKNKVSNKEFTDVKDKVVDYHNSKDREFDFSRVIFVSNAGFIPNSLKIAADSNIECYELSKDKHFEKLEHTDL